MIGEAAEVDALLGRRGEEERTLVLLGTDRRWLKSALEEVLSPEGFRLSWVGDSEELLEKGGAGRPAFVIVDEELPGLDVEDAARELVSGPLGQETPLLLYTSSSAARVREHARALDAGFWDLLTDPLRPAQVIARMRRLLSIGRRMKTSGGPAEAAAGAEETSVGVLSLDELGRILPAIGALAEREDKRFSIVLLAPTSAGNDRERREEMAASVCGPNLRTADLCARIDDAEVAIVAFDTSAAEAQSLVDRLNAQLGARAEREGRGEGPFGLSAAIVELKPSSELERAVRRAGRRGDAASVSLDEVVELFHLEDAKSALRDAREAGGGVRVIEVA